MAKYSICFLDAMGLTRRSALSEFDTDSDAVTYARRADADGGLIEVWKDGGLVDRIDARKVRHPGIAPVPAP